jgi:hypothetical protein
MVAESVDPSFMEALRENGFYCSTDSKTFETFDSLYDYDLYPTWKSVLVGERPLSDYVTLLNHQHSKFNRNDYKLRFFENHDQERIFNLVSESKAKTWIAFMFFLKGWILIFNGIETKSKKLPDLFNKDVIEFDNTDDEMVLFIKELIGIKHSFDDKVIKQFEVKLIEGVITINYTFRNTDEEWLGLFDVDQVGVFNLEGNYSDLKTDDKYKGKFEMKKTYYLLRKE